MRQNEQNERDQDQKDQIPRILLVLSNWEVGYLRSLEICLNIILFEETKYTIVVSTVKKGWS